MKISRKTKNYLIHAVLASTTFALSSPLAHAACGDLTQLNANTNQNADAHEGYNFAANNITLTVIGGNIFSSTVNGADVSIDNNCGNNGGFANTTVEFQNHSQVTGIIGYSNAIGTINLTSAGTQFLELSANTIKAGTINFASTGEQNILVMNNAATIMANIDNTGPATESNLFFARSGNIIGNIGSTNPLSVILFGLQGAGTLNINANSVAATTTILNNESSILELQNTSGGMSFTGDIVSGNNAGALSILNVGNTTINGNIGAPGAALNAFNIGGPGNNTVSVNGDIYANTSTFQANGSLTFNGNLSTNNNNTGTLLILNTGDTTINGDIGAFGAALNTFNIGGPSNKTVTVNGNIYANTTTFLTDQTLKFGSDGVGYSINGDINTVADGIGSLRLSGAAGVTVTGTVGETHPLKEIALHNSGVGTNVFFEDDIKANMLRFHDSSIGVFLNDGVTITSPVDTNVGTTNTHLFFSGSGKITGSIGNTNPLSSIFVNTTPTATATLELNGTNIKVDVIALEGGGGPTTLLLKAPTHMEVTAEITTSGDLLNNLEIRNEGNTHVTGNIGENLQRIGTISLASSDSSHVTFVGNVFAGTTIFENHLTLMFGDNNNNYTLTSDIDSATGSTGRLFLSHNTQVEGKVGATGYLHSVNLMGADDVYTFNDVFAALNLNFTHAASELTYANFLATDFPLIDKIDNFTNTNYVGNVLFSSAGNLVIPGPIGKNLPINSLILNNPNLTLTLQDEVNVGNYPANNGGIFFAEDAKLILDDGVIVNGTITNLSGVASTGTLEFLGNGQVNGDIGDSVAPSHNLKAVLINGPAGSTVPLRGDIWADETSVNNGGTFEVSGNYIIDGNLTLTANSGSILSLAPAVDPLEVTGTFTMNNGTTLRLDMQNKDVGNMLVGNAQILGGEVDVINPVIFPVGSHRINIVTGGGGSVINELNVVHSNSLLQHYSTIADNIYHTLDLLITTQSAAALTNGQDNTQGVGGALDYIINNNISVTGELQQIINQTYFEITDLAVLLRGLETLAPIVDGAVLWESFNTQRAAFEVVEDRLDQVGFGFVRPLASRTSGYAAGDKKQLELVSPATWVKVFGQDAHQTERQGVPGYKNNTWGIAGGGDTMLSEQSLLGLSLSWSGMRLYHEISDSRTKTWSLQGSLYGSHYFDNPLFMKWTAGLAYNNYLTHRNVYFGDVYLTPRGQYHGWQTGAKAEMGYVCGKQSLHVIPLTSLYYSHLALSSYTETQAGTANQEFEKQSFDLLLGGAGVKLVYDYPFTQYDMSTIQPDAHFMAFYDFVGDRMETTSQFTGGGPSFTTQGFAPARTSYNVGAGISAFSESGIVLTAVYDFNVKDQYRAHSGSLKFRYEW